MPWSYLFHILLAICITSFSVETHQNSAYCQVFEEAKHVKAHNITFYSQNTLFYWQKYAFFQLLKLYVQQLIKCLTKLLLQAGGKCSKKSSIKEMQ